MRCHRTWRGGGGRRRTRASQLGSATSARADVSRHSRSSGSSLRHARSTSARVCEPDATTHSTAVHPPSGTDPQHANTQTRKRAEHACTWFVCDANAPLRPSARLCRWRTRWRAARGSACCRWRPERCQARTVEVAKQRAKHDTQESTHPHASVLQRWRCSARAAALSAQRNASAAAAQHTCRRNTASVREAHARQRRAPRAPQRTAPRPLGSACRTSSPNSAPHTPVARMRAHALSAHGDGSGTRKGLHARTRATRLRLIWGAP